MGYRRSRNERKKLKKLYRKTKNSCRGGAWYNDDKERYIRYSASNTPGYSKYLRKLSNRKLRHSNDVLNYGLYRKIFDYWWVLF